MTFTKTIEGKEYQCKRLTFRDMCELGDVLHSQNTKLLTQQLRALYGAAGIDEDKLPIVCAELTRRPSVSEVWRWLYTPWGALEACVRIMGLSKDQIEDMPGNLDFVELVNEVLSHAREDRKRDIPLSQTSGVGNEIGDTSVPC